MSYVKYILVCAVSFLLISCTGLLLHTTPPVHLSTNDKMAVAPFENNTKRAAAGTQVQSVAVKTLHIRGFQKIAVLLPVREKKRNVIVHKRAPQYKAQAERAKRQAARYLVTGVVTEWSSLERLGCESLVGVTIQLVDTQSGRIIWTADGSKQGRNPGALATAITEELITAMLVRLSA